MSASGSHSGIVLELAEEFLERYRRGQRPSLKEYIERHPELAAEIKEVFPAMALMENNAVADESLADEGAENRRDKPSESAPPEQLGDYRVLREIGRGGMGIVYEAEQVSLGRHVALKLLPRKVLLDATQKRRFEREAKAAAKLHHTNIVPVFGVGEHEGSPYYVMQFIQGLGLDDVLDELRRLQDKSNLPSVNVKMRAARPDVSAADLAHSLMTGTLEYRAGDSGSRSESQGADAHRSDESATSRLSGSFALSSSSISLPRSGAKGRQATYWQSVAHLGTQVAGALDYAHKQGILHRDIKPSNLLLDAAGTVWVADFGLARAEDEDHLTQTGDIVGTLRYMPPEAFEGRVDKRGDIYALGLTLYEMLATRPAFDERDRHRLIKRVTTEEPARLEKVNRAIPRDLVTIVHKAIDREPGRRYATSGEFAADLQRFLDDEPIQARRQTQLERYWRWARHNPGIAVLGGVLTAVLVLASLASLLVAGRMSALADRASHNEEQALRNEEQAKQNAQRAEQSEQDTAAALATVAAQKTEVEDSLSGSLEYFDAAVKQADNYETRKSIFTLLARFDMVLNSFVEKHPRDQQLQLTLARRLAERGQKHLAMNQPTKAQDELEKSSAIFTRLLAAGNDWKVLTPIEMKSENDAKMELQNDGSVFVDQQQPAKNDTYTLVFQTKLKGITGLRLETLADSRLPRGGPGWMPDGNFNLNELSLQAAPNASPDEAKPIALKDAWADIHQGEIQRAFDGNPETLWHVQPAFNTDHTAVFELAEKVGDGGTVRLTVRLIQKQLGRFRLSITNGANPWQAVQAPQIRRDLRDSEVMDCDIALGKAYAQQDRANEAIASFAQALPLAANRAGKAKIIAEAAPRKGVLEKLAERAAGDARFQAELVRHYVARGQAALANAARAKARAWLEAKLAKDPENAALAAELAQVLLDKIVAARMTTSQAGAVQGQFVRLDLPGSSRQFPRCPPDDDKKCINLAELQVFQGSQNIALRKKASQSSNYNNVLVAERAVDGNTRGNDQGNPYAHTGFENDPWWEVDLGSEQAIDRIVIWNRRLGRDDNEYDGRMNHSRIRVLDHSRKLVLEQVIEQAPRPSTEIVSVPGAEGAPAKALLLKNADGITHLAAAYAVNGLHDKALQYFSSALQRTDGYEARKPIVEVAGRFDDVLAALIKRQPDDPQLQLALARNLAERGKQRLAEKQPAQAQAELEKSRAIFARLHSTSNNLKILSPIEMKAETGAKMELQNDGSIFVHPGQPPKRDIYTLVFQTEWKDIIGLRLEALADSRLPRGGPGWSGNGNFHLSELTLQAAPADSPDKARAIALRDAWADFSQVSENMNVRGAIDGNPMTGWAISPDFKKDHTAIFELAEKVDDGGASRWTVRLIQQHPNVATKLGRFRLSFTNDRATLQVLQLRPDLQESELADCNSALGTAYAQQGRTKEAVATFTEALHLTTDRGGKARILVEAAPLAGVAEKLIEQAPDDWQLQADLARQLAARGKQHLSEKRPAQAQAELEKARAIFTRLLAKYSKPQWTVLKPTEMTSKGGATLSLLEDGSVLASGKNPDRDEYVVVARPGLERITALRLEALPDPSLPQNGPGRSPADIGSPGGYFHLNKLRVFSGGQPCPLTNIVVDQPIMRGNDPQPYRHIIDGKDDNLPGWGNFRRVGQPNTATIEMRVTRAPKDDLKIEMVFSQWSWRQLNLGRFRLAVTNAPDPIQALEFHKDLQESEVAELYAALAKAHVQQGHADEAEKLLEQAPGDGRSLAELARQFAAQGEASLAKAALAKARTRYEAKLAKEPENAALAAELAQMLLDQQQQEKAARWMVFKPVEAKSALGATLSILPDHSILASGTNPQNDRYRVVATVGADIDLVAVRLEALTHSSLPGNGPGRYPGRANGGLYAGNFAQLLWKVTATSPKRKDPISLEFNHVSADAGPDFQPNGLWNIWDGGEGRNCTAIWSLSKPVALVAGTTLTFEMQFGGIGAENLGRFRLSVSEDVAFFAAKITDPWVKLAAVYHLLGDKKALDSLLKHHPAAAAGIGDLYVATGRTREAIPFLVEASAADPKDTMLSIKVAALQAWFGQDKELAATRQRIRAFAKDTQEWSTAERAAKACSILASTDKAELEAALALARKGVELVECGEGSEWALLALGMAEYRGGNYAAAEEALRDAAEAAPKNLHVPGMSSHYRAMSLFRQGKKEEARKLAIGAVAEMKPLPKDERNPLTGDAYHDDLILWLAYKEAKATIGFDAAPPPKADNDKK